MMKRTWRYGTVLQATVIENDKVVIALKDEFDEGHVLVGVTHDVEPKKGDKVKMQFTKGGRTGGFWKITEITE